MQIWNGQIVPNHVLFQLLFRLLTFLELVSSDTEKIHLFITKSSWTCLSYKLNIKRQIHTLLCGWWPLHLQSSSSLSVQATMIRIWTFQVTNEEINSIKPVSPYKRPKYRSTFGSGGRGNLVPGVRFNFEASGKGDDILRASAKRLDQYTLSRERELILTHSKFRNMYL